MAKNTKPIFTFNSWLIRLKRESMNLTQEDLAKKVGVSRFVIIRAEAGDSSKAGSLARIAKALSIPLPVLYDEGIKREDFLKKQKEIFNIKSPASEEYRSSAA